MKRLTEAIAEAGRSQGLLSHLTTIEAKLAYVDQRIEAHKIPPLTAAKGEIRSFLLEHVMGLRSLLRADVSRARAALMKHIRPLVLTPKHTPTGPLYAVTGGVDVPLSKGCVMPVVARDGIGTPTAIDRT